MFHFFVLLEGILKDLPKKEVWNHVCLRKSLISACSESNYSIAKVVQSSADPLSGQEWHFPIHTPHQFFPPESRSSTGIWFNWILTDCILFCANFNFFYPMVSSLQLLSILSLLSTLKSQVSWWPHSLFALGCFSLKNYLVSFWGGREEINICTQSSILTQKSVSKFSNI